ncbi:MAG: hypothetical protein O2894_11060, partial [Planctomycetota bacterium]|nr:hypothetical protein [Planctomycetota bacterium]
MRPLIVDLTYASDLALGAGRGVAAAAVDQQLARHAALPPWPGAEPPAWFDLPLDEAPARAVMAWADSLPPTDDVVLVGIGGSALTARVVAALRTPEAPRLHVLDTVDPVAVQALTTRLDPARSVLVGISKSGTTLETTAVFLVIEAWLEKALGAAAPARIAVVVGSQPNPLRARASERGYACFDIPVGVGGRFSALTAAGLLPARLVGVDPLALLRGAAALRARCAGSDVRSHPALALAAHHAAAE